MVRLFYGTEEYLLDKNVEACTAGIEMPEMNVSRFYDGYDPETVRRECLTEPFLSEKRAVVLRLTELKASDALKKLILEVPESTVLLIAASSADKRSAVFKALQKDAVACTKPEPPKVASLVARVAGKEGKKAAPEAVTEMVKRLCYYEEDSVSLYSVISTTRQLMASGDITVSLVRAMLPESAAGKIWNLLALVCGGKKPEAFALLTYLLDSGESGIGLLSVLLKGFRLAWKEAVGVPESVPRFQYAAATGFTPAVLAGVQEVLEEGIERLKNGAEESAAVRVAVAKCFDRLSL